MRRTVRVNVDLDEAIHARLKAKQKARRKQGLPFLSVSLLATLAIIDSLMQEEMQYEVSPHRPV